MITLDEEINLMDRNKNTKRVIINTAKNKNKFTNCPSNANIIITLTIIIISSTSG